MSTLHALFEQEEASQNHTFGGENYDRLPCAVGTYLRHAIAEDTPLASAVRLHMTGEIKLKRWLPFTATQVVRLDQGFIWNARVNIEPAFISGHDQFINGTGKCKWKLMGLLKVMSAKGPDISRSAAGRMAIERILLPSAFCRPDISWSGTALTATATSKIATFDSQVTLNIDPSGMIKSVAMPRWGNPDRGAFKSLPFGGLIEEENTFDGYTIPTRLRIGWHFGTERFDKGEFFRCTITNAEFRY